MQATNQEQAEFWVKSFPEAAVDVPTEGSDSAVLEPMPKKRKQDDVAAPIKQVGVLLSGHGLHLV